MTNEALPHVMLATQAADFGLMTADTAQERAQALADEGGKVVYLRHPETDKVLGKAKPAKAKAAPKKAAPKATAKATPKKAAKKVAPKAEKAKGPRGMVVEILKLASRAKGVSPAELNELTTWKGAPWRWLFSNPKKNGYCDRWGYSFEVVKIEDRGVRYHVAKL
jgi:hypothetical protein